VNAWFRPVRYFSGIVSAAPRGKVTASGPEFVGINPPEGVRARKVTRAL
jgi:hypothetical protein